MALQIEPTHIPEEGDADQQGVQGLPIGGVLVPTGATQECTAPLTRKPLKSILSTYQTKDFWAKFTGKKRGDWIKFSGSGSTFMVGPNLPSGRVHAIREREARVHFPPPLTWSSMVYPKVFLGPPVYRLGFAPSYRNTPHSSPLPLLRESPREGHKYVARTFNNLFDEHCPEYLKLHEIRHLQDADLNKLAEPFRDIVAKFSSMPDVDLFSPPDTHGINETSAPPFYTPLDAAFSIFYERVHGDMSLQGMLQIIMELTMAVINRMLSYLACHEPGSQGSPFLMTCPPLFRLVHRLQDNISPRPDYAPYREMFRGAVAPDLHWQLPLTTRDFEHLELANTAVDGSYRSYLPRSKFRHPALSVFGTFEVNQPNLTVEPVGKLVEAGWTISVVSKPPSAEKRADFDQFDNDTCNEPESLHLKAREEDKGIIHEAEQSMVTDDASATLLSDHRDAVGYREGSAGHDAPPWSTISGIEGSASWRLPPSRAAEQEATDCGNVHSMDSELGRRVNAGEIDFNSQYLGFLSDWVGSLLKPTSPETLQDNQPKKESVEIVQQAWSQMVSCGTSICHVTDLWSNYCIFVRLPDQRQCLISSNKIDLFRRLAGMNCPGGKIVDASSLPAFLFEERSNLPKEPYEGPEEVVEVEHRKKAFKTIFELFGGILLASVRLRLCSLGCYDPEKDLIGQLFEVVQLPPDQTSRILNDIAASVADRADRLRENRQQLKALLEQHIKGLDGIQVGGSGKDSNHSLDDDASHNTERKPGEDPRPPGTPGALSRGPSGAADHSNTMPNHHNRCAKALAIVSTEAAVFKGILLAFHSERPRLESKAPTSFVRRSLVMAVKNTGMNHAARAPRRPMSSFTLEVNSRVDRRSSYDRGCEEDSNPSTLSDTSMAQSSASGCSNWSPNSSTLSPAPDIPGGHHKLQFPLFVSLSDAFDPTFSAQRLKIEENSFGNLHLDCRIRIGQGTLGDVWVALAHLEGDAKGGQQLIAVKIVEGQEAAAGLEHEARIYEYLNRAGIGISLRVPRYYGLFDQVSPRSPNRAHALVVSLDLGKPIEDLKPYEDKLRAAVHELPSLDICHLDLSPNNILVDDQRCIMLVDFHLAQLTTNASAKQHDLEALEELL